MPDTMLLMADALFANAPVGSSGGLATGTRIDVRSRFVGSWTHGFEVAEKVDERGYRIKRLSDGAVLPDIFDEEEVRPERRKRDFWWY